MKKILLMVFMISLLIGVISPVSLSEEKITASDGEEMDYFGKSVSVSGDYTVVGAYEDDDKGTDSGSAYIFRKDGVNWMQQAKITASDGEGYDWFGWSVSISGDYAIVGAFGDDDKGTDSGSAYIFKYNGTNWIEQAKLTASDGEEMDYFGWSVSIDGDYAVIGAQQDDDNGYNSGSVYIFWNNGTDWVEQTKIVVNDGVAEDYFGWSVSVSGDYAIVGAYRDGDKGSGSGSAYVFKRDGTIWLQQEKITASDGTIGDEFGHSVSIDGGYAIVGAYRDDDKGSNSGSAYIFKRDGISWLQEAKLTASDGAGNDYFGYSVSISGDYAVVGSYGDDDKGRSSGSAYLFKRDGTNWVKQSKLTASDGALYNFFGRSVSINGGYLVVGARGDEDRGFCSGSAYIFEL